jgi:hypothetical protein
MRPPRTQREVALLAEICPICEEVGLYTTGIDQYGVCTSCDRVIVTKGEHVAIMHFAQWRAFAASHGFCLGGDA